MRAVVASREDVASVNIRDRMLEAAEWEAVDPFDGAPAYRRDDLLLVTLRDLHLRRDHVDRELAEAFGEAPEVVVYASRHSSESGIRSFTVHPLGNWGEEARYGGRPHTLVATAPHWMTEALRILKARTEGFEHEVTFEATHHGPHLETPAFFVEVGSDPGAWRDRAAARAVADTILALRPREAPAALGLGGGHYVPRMTDLALTRRVSFGHLVPSYALGDLDPAVWRQAVAKTPGAELVFVHGTSLPERVQALVEGSGLRPIRARDLDPL